MRLKLPLHSSVAATVASRWHTVEAVVAGLENGRLNGIGTKRHTKNKKIVIMFENKIMRNQELIGNWRRCLKDAFDSDGYDCRDNVIDKALACGKPRYDVSYDYALRMAQQMVRDGKPCPLSNRLKKLMWEEICGHVREAMRSRHYTLARALAFVLAEKRASRYFISRKQASKIIYYEKHNNRNSRRRAV